MCVNMSNEEVSDKELAGLKQRKEELLRRAVELKSQFADWETTEIKTSGKTEKDFLLAGNPFQDLSTLDKSHVDHSRKKCVAFSCFITGIKFSEVDKRWISDRKYLYTANVKSKAVEFGLKVTVDTEDGINSKPDVLDVVCDFINIRQCYLIEITPWVRRFTEAKDSSNLFSAVSDYTEHNVTRSKILRKLQNQRVITSKERTEEDGGILVLLHAKDDPDFIYFEIRWILRFVVSLWRIENYFIVQPISAGDEFLEANDELLQSFCKCGMKKTDLEDMWKKLCTAVQLDESHSTIEETTSTTT